MPDPAFDLTRKYVRILGSLPNDLVEFAFAVGDPDVSVELVMPRPAFEQFCRAHGVEFLSPEDAPAADGEQTADADFQWGMRQAARQGIRK